MRRVVVTGLGVVSPNGNDVPAFTQALRNGVSGLRFMEELKTLNFRCQVGGIPELSEIQQQQLTHYGLSEAPAYLQYALLAGLEAWKDAGLQLPEPEGKDVDYDCGSIIGTGFAAMDIKGKKLVPAIDSGQIKKIRSDLVEQVMINAPTTLMTKILALGNVNFSNSNACATGTDAVLMAYQQIKSGMALRMLAGGSDAYSPYYWGLFDAMRILSPEHNEHPEMASRPMSASAGGFIPGAGAAILLLEEAESAMRRKAPIYAEICGGHMNTGGQRKGGSMTAANNEAIILCIQRALEQSGTKAEEVDYISGHLTATKADAAEILNWKTALGAEFGDFPLINSLKSMTGHLLGASGAIETLAAIIQMKEGFVHGNINCEDINPSIEKIISTVSIPARSITKNLNCAIKASFGFGDVNSCLVLKKFNPDTL